MRAAVISETSGGTRTVQAFLQVRVRSVTSYGNDIRCYEVVDLHGGMLPPFEPGSHVDVHVPEVSFGVRQYSLCGDADDRRSYRFAVQREASGRGGSKAIFAHVQVGSLLTISVPRNNFKLYLGAQRHLLLAGGIGITPMMSMLFYLRRASSDFMLHYCTRSLERTAFLDILRPAVAEGFVTIHWDGGDPAKGMDILGSLAGYQPGTHLYYCGPPGFMRAVATASGHWQAGTTHREFFTPSFNDPGIAVHDTDEASGGLGRSFQVKIRSTGQTLDIPTDKTILAVLREHGFGIESACELGICGTCRTRFLEGEPDHRDFVLEVDEQEKEMTVCCSRSKSPLLVLDL